MLDELSDFLQDDIYDIYENANDFEILQIAYLLIQDEINRLSYDLDNNAIKKEYNTLTTIEMQIKDILDNYV